MDLVIRDDAAGVADAAAEFILERLREPEASDLGLAGGSTPLATYERLAAADPGWERITAWLGDERWVPPDHPECNAGAARSVLTDRVPLTLLAPDWSLGDPAAAAAAYERALDEAIGPAPGLTLLGIGDDGHTASLFPGTAALEERDRRYVANFVPAKEAWRLTATFPLLWSAATLAFIVTGEAKAEPVRRILDEDADLPAGTAARGARHAVWFLDGAAASLLRGR
jgi:6-phosphogluconolactonase